MAASVSLNLGWAWGGVRKVSVGRAAQRSEAEDAPDDISSEEHNEDEAGEHHQKDEQIATGCACAGELLHCHLHQASWKDERGKGDRVEKGGEGKG